jgi:mono/diheme cytochrome c family protein
VRAATIALAATAAWTGAVRAQPAATPVFTAAQAAAGRAAYTARCAACHLDDLDGNGDAPQLAGDAFLSGWKQKTTSDLLQYLKGMPPGGPALTESEYLTVVAFLLEQNGAVAGETALTAGTGVAIGTVATGRRPAR